MMPVRRLVLDTDVIVAALRSSTGASAMLVKAAIAGSISLLASVAIALEYEAVCRRHEHQAAAGLSDRELDAFIDTIYKLVIPVQIHYLLRPLVPDPNDDMVLETAINGGAQAVVAFNKKHFGAVPSRFGIELLSPGEALTRIES